MRQSSHTDFFSPRFQYNFAPHAPTLRVPSGDSLRVICPDSDNALADGSILPDDRRQREVPARLQGNPMAGPIWVESAAPGDGLAVHIDTIELDRQMGQTGLAPNHGLLPERLLLGSAPAGTEVPRHLFRWHIDVPAGVARLANPLGSHSIAVTLDPFIGCIGVSPAPDRQPVSTLLCGVHGGNMDVPCVRPGTTLYLPVFVEGGLLMMGDIHAAQGHGEIIGGGIETSGKIRCTVHVVPRMGLRAPRARDETSLFAFGFADELRMSVAEAYAHLLDWLVTDFGLDRWDGYNLISQAASITIGGLGEPPIAVAARLPLAALPADVARAVALRY